MKRTRIHDRALPPYSFGEERMNLITHIVGSGIAIVILHYAINGLIAGTYTPIILFAIAPKHLITGWELFGLEWYLAVIAVVLIAIDSKRYKMFSMICCTGIGWSIIFFLPRTIDILPPEGFWILFSCAVAYSIIADFCRLSGCTHIFVILGSILQFITIIAYVL